MSRLIIVPKHIDEIVNSDLGNYDGETMAIWRLTDKEFDSLSSTGVFADINGGLGCTIKDCEDVKIGNFALPRTLRIVAKCVAGNVGNAELIKFCQLIDLAIKYRTCISFDF